MNIGPSRLLIMLFILTLVAGCNGARQTPAPRTLEILVTSEAGQKQAALPGVPFQEGRAQGLVVQVFPDVKKQTIDGIGTSFTESSAFVLAHLDPARRRQVMERIYGLDGANFSLARTHMGACDFCVEGRYSYADVADDAELQHFSIQPDREGFDPARYPGVRDAAYDLLPMIQEALAIKEQQGSAPLRIIASAWTAPPWMKDSEAWYVPASAENNWQGVAGSLKPEHEATYARYITRYLDAYADAGVPLWGLTPVNEPHGNGGHWESMNFSPESQAAFIKTHLGPALRDAGHGDIRLLAFDQNRDGLQHWADVMFNDPELRPYLYGIAVHWYSSTFKVYEDVLDRVHDQHPAYSLLHSEGCIDDLGKVAPEGYRDPEGYQEEDWFGNDTFWWNRTCSDWAYTAPWDWAKADDHPLYTPVHRYARNIIVSLDHWLTGWVDWNIVLDSRGGPNHVGNFCGAPIMIDTAQGEVYYTPVFDVLSQFSRTIRPGDVALQTARQLDGLDPDTLHACATLNDQGVVSVQLLNTSGEALTVNLQVGAHHAAVPMAANAVQTVRVQLAAQ